MQDKLEKGRADAKNAVEEYVYEMRDKLCGALAEFMLDKVNKLMITGHVSLTSAGILCKSYDLRSAEP